VRRFARIAAQVDVERAMRITVFAVPALLLAGAAVAQSDGRANPTDPQAKVPPVEFRSAFEGYRPFADQEMRDWRKANEEVGAAGGHMGHRPGQGSGRQTPKPQPGKPQNSGGPPEKSLDAPAREGHGGHK
jgi:hypothetical protein